MTGSIEKRMEKIADRLRDSRLDKGWSQDELARRAGIDRKTVNRIENGHFAPSIYTLLALCESLKVEARDIIGA